MTDKNFNTTTETVFVEEELEIRPQADAENRLDKSPGAVKKLGLALLATAMVAGVLAALLVFTADASAKPHQVAMPVSRSVTNLGQLTKPHHDYPAADIPVPSGTGVHAVLGGRVSQVGYLGGCGNAVTIVRGNTEFRYCHGNGTFFVKAGQEVGTGQRIMRSGNSGHSFGPHLHIQIRVAGTLRCPQPMLKAAWERRTSDPQTLPRSGCSY